MEFNRLELGIIRVAIAREVIRMNRRTRYLIKNRARLKDGVASAHAMESSAVSQLWDKVKEAK